MQTRTYQLYTALSQANAANIQIIAPGYIHGICWSAYMDATADNSALQAELSFQSASQLTVHNGLGIIDTIAVYANVGAAGSFRGDNNKTCMGMYIPVGIGMIIYLNTNAAGGIVRACIHVIEK